MTSDTWCPPDVRNLRLKYRGYMPNRLAKLSPRVDVACRGQGMLLEFISWPWVEADGKVYINARVIDDPTTMARYECRKQISPVSWSMLRQQAYRAGFKSGVAAGYKEVRG